MPKKPVLHEPVQSPVRQITGWLLGTIIVIVVAYACYNILGIFFGR